MPYKSVRVLGDQDFLPVVMSSGNRVVNMHAGIERGRCSSIAFFSLFDKPALPSHDCGLLPYPCRHPEFLPACTWLLAGSHVHERSVHLYMGTVLRVSCRQSRLSNASPCSLQRMHLSM